MLKLLYGDSPTLQDLVIIHLTALIATGLLALLYAQSVTPLAFLTFSVTTLLALDEAGGIVANATRSTSNWYRRQPALLSYVFHAVHAVQPLVMALVLGLPWSMFWFLYGYQFAAGALLVRLRTHPIQKPLAAALLCIGSVLHVGLSMDHPILLILGLMYIVKLVFMFPVDHYATERT